MTADPIEVSFLSKKKKKDLQKHAGFTTSLSANSEIPGKEGGVEKVSSERNLSSLVTGKEEDVWF